MTYQIGVVYIWQNQTGAMAFLNGSECTVTGPERPYWTGFTVQHGFPTDSKFPNFPGDPVVMAWPGDLRRKQPPTGLTTVLAWFTAPAPREVEMA